MFKRIIVPLDGSNMAEAVLPAVTYLANQLEAIVILLHVIEENAPITVHGEMHLTQPDVAVEYLRNVAENFLPNVEVETHVHKAMVKNVAKSIYSHTSELSSDLIVMCSHGKGGFSGWLVGSIAQQVIGMGNVPVLLLSPEEQTKEFAIHNILIPLDGNPEHEQGLQPAVEIARYCQAQLHFLQVVPTPGTLKGEPFVVGRLMPGSIQELLNMAEEEAHTYLSECARQAAQSGLSVATAVRRGDPAKQIIEQAQQLSADMIVLGTHGKAGQNAFWEGSVASKIPGRTLIPILMVPVHQDI